MKNPLKQGDEIRIIAPSSAWNPKRAKQYKIAQNILEELGFKVTFGPNLKGAAYLDAVSVKKRLEDLHDAYADSSVKAIMALNGGWVANSLLPHIDWSLLRSNPKPLIGYSDITVLLNAIYARTGQICYLGPNLGTFGSNHGTDYTPKSLASVLCGSKKPITLQQSKSWGEGKKRKEYPTRPWTVIQPGVATGLMLGGNIATLYLLQGTDYYPAFNKDTVLLLEDDAESGEYTALEFDRRLESLLQQPNARKYIRAIVIGRFQKASKVDLDTIRKIFESKNLKGIPIVANVDFGHTQPLLTLPIGGTMRVNATNNKVTLELVNY